MNREGLSLVGRMFGEREFSCVDISLHVQALEDKRTDGGQMVNTSLPRVVYADHGHHVPSPAVASLFSSLFPSRSGGAKEKRERGMAKSPKK